MPDWKDNLKMVFSTDPDAVEQYNSEEEENTAEPKDQKLYILLDRKHRKGKKVTLVQGFKGKEEDLKILGKLLKTKCGVGGTVKNGEIILQGDFREKIIPILNKLGYKTKRSGG